MPGNRGIGRWLIAPTFIIVVFVTLLLIAPEHISGDGEARPGATIVAVVLAGLSAWVVFKAFSRGDDR